MKKFTKIMSVALFSGMLYVSSSFTTSIEASSAPKFKDVPSTHWASWSINKGVESGIIKGYQDNTFRPNQKVTEAEFLAMLVRGYEPAELRSFVAGEPWANPYYELAYSKNYPVKSTRTEVINRTYVAELIASTQGAGLRGDKAIQYVLDKDLASGKNPKERSIKSYDGQGTLTRAEAITFVQRALAKGEKDETGKPILLDVSKKEKKPVAATDKIKASIDLMNKIEGYGKILGYNYIKNFNEFVAIGRNNKEENLNFSYMYMSLYPDPATEDFRVTTRDFNQTDDKNSRKMLEFILNQYGLDTKKDQIMEKLVALPAPTIAERKSVTWDLQGYKIRVIKTTEVKGNVQVQMIFDIEND